MTNGFWIVVDGPNGTGKSTLMKSLAAALRQEGHDVLETREPGGSPLAERLRALLLDSSVTMDSGTQLLLFNAARRSHIMDTIRPALAEGKIVLCDRFLASTLVFQSMNPDGSAGISFDTILDWHKRSCDNATPDFSIYLDAPLDVRRARLSARNALNNTPDRFEEFSQEFDRAAADLFLKCGPIIDRDHTIIDAAREPSIVADDAIQAVLARLNITSPNTNAMPRAA